MRGINWAVEAQFSTAASLVFSCLSESSPAATRFQVIVNLFSGCLGKSEARWLGR